MRALPAAQSPATAMAELPSCRAWRRTLARPRVLVGGLTALAALSAYLLTLCPSLTWADGASDSGEIAAAAYSFGVMHPTSYPLYTLLGGAWSHLPWGEPALLLNVFSALCGATAAGFIALLILACVEPAAGPAHRRIHMCAAVAGGLTFAAIPAVWVQATATETRMLAAALAVAVLLALAAHLRHGAPRPLLLAWGLEGLALAGHLLCLALLPALVMVTLRTALRRKHGRYRDPGATLGLCIRALAATLPGLALYALIPLRAATQPALDWGDPRTPARFLWLVSGAQYRSFMGATPELVLGRVAARLGTLWAGMGPAAVVGALGLALLCRRRPCLGAALVLVAGAGVAVSSLYGAAAAPDYLIPSEIALAAGLGALPICLLAGGAATRWRPYVLLLVPLAAGNLAWQMHAERATDAQAQSVMARGYALSALSGLPAHALILAEGDEQTFALWYAQVGLRLRPDVAVVNTSLLAWYWYAATVHRHYPWVQWGRALAPTGDRDLWAPDPDRRAAVREEALVRANAGRTPLYWTTPDDAVDPTCGLAIAGNFFRCVPLGIGP